MLYFLLFDFFDIFFLAWIHFGLDWNISLVMLMTAAALLRYEWLARFHESCYKYYFATCCLHLSYNNLNICPQKFLFLRMTRPGPAVCRSDGMAGSTLLSSNILVSSFLLLFAKCDLGQNTSTPHGVAN